jgi:lysophospholipase L1-like esterase
MAEMIPTIRRVAIALLVVASPLHAVSDGKRVHVTLVGDSLAYGAGDEAGKGIAGRLEPELRALGFESVAATNLAVTGATTSDVLAKLRQKATREAIERADAIVLSAGANDLRAMLTGEETIESPLLIADRVLRNLETIVGEIRGVNEKARILIIGAYLPLSHERAVKAFEPFVALWDGLLMAQFAEDSLVEVVRMSDIIDGPEKLSRQDWFHPGGEAYQAAAKRIAGMLAAE